MSKKDWDFGDYAIATGLLLLLLKLLGVLK